MSIGGIPGIGIQTYRAPTTRLPTFAKSEIEAAIIDIQNTPLDSPEIWEKTSHLLQMESQNSSIDFQSSAEVAEYGQSMMASIKQNIESANSGLSELSRIDEVIDQQYQLLVERHGVEDTNKHWRGHDAEKEIRIASLLDGINRGIGMVGADVAALLQNGYSVNGDVAHQNEDGSLTLGSFTVTYDKGGLSAYLYTPDQTPPADLPAGTKTEVLDGHIREITTLTTRSPFDPLPGKRLDIKA